MIEEGIDASERLEQAFLEVRARRASVTDAADPANSDRAEPPRQVATEASRPLPDTSHAAPLVETTVSASDLRSVIRQELGAASDDLIEFELLVAIVRDLVQRVESLEAEVRLGHERS